MEIDKEDTEIKYLELNLLGLLFTLLLLHRSEQFSILSVSSFPLPITEQRVNEQFVTLQIFLEIFETNGSPRGLIKGGRSSCMPTTA